MTAIPMEEIGRVRSAMDSVVVDNPRAVQVRERFDYLIAHGQAQGPKGTRRGQLLVGPSQSGKSTIINSYVEMLNTPERILAGEIPVLDVTLRANISTKGLGQNILQRIADYGFYSGPYTGSENELTQRVHKSMSVDPVERREAVRSFAAPFDTWRPGDVFEAIVELGVALENLQTVGVVAGGLPMGDGRYERVAVQTECPNVVFTPLSRCPLLAQD